MLARRSRKLSRIEVVEALLLRRDGDFVEASHERASAILLLGDLLGLSNLYCPVRGL